MLCFPGGSIFILRANHDWCWIHLFNEIAPGRSCSLLIKTFGWTQTWNTVWKQDSSSCWVWMWEGGWGWWEDAALGQKEVQEPLLFKSLLFQSPCWATSHAMKWWLRCQLIEYHKGLLLLIIPRHRTGDLVPISQAGRNVFITMLIQSLLEQWYFNCSSVFLRHNPIPFGLLVYPHINWVIAL